MNLDTIGEFRSALINLKARLKEPAARRSKVPSRRAILKQVEAALQRINQGAYGICRSCFLVIPRGELLMHPYTEFCGRCQTRQTAGYRRAKG